MKKGVDLTSFHDFLYHYNSYKNNNDRENHEIFLIPMSGEIITRNFESLVVLK